MQWRAQCGARSTVICHYFQNKSASTSTFSSTDSNLKYSTTPLCRLISIFSKPFGGRNVWLSHFKVILTSARVFILLLTRSWWWSGPEVPLKKKRIPPMPPVLPCGGRRLSRGLSHPVFVTWSKLEVSFLPKLKEVLAWSWHAVKIRIPNSTHSSLHGLQCELHENTLLLIHSLSSGLKMSKVWTAASCL